MLDLSHNELTALDSDQYNFSFPENLTKLYMSNNRLWKLPTNRFYNLSAMNVIDVRNNFIETFELKLLKSVSETGLELHIAGNFN